METGQYYCILFMIAGSTFLILKKIDSAKEAEIKTVIHEVKDSVHFNCVRCGQKNIIWLYDSCYFRSVDTMHTTRKRSSH